MTNNIDVVIIDSGINTSHLPYDNIVGGMTIQQNIERDGFEFIDNEYNDEIGHGTAITDLFIKLNPLIKIYAIKIFSQAIETDEKLLMTALEYVYQKLKCKVINLSIGIRTSIEKKALYELCNKLLLDKKIIIVAAFDNGGAISYPAAFDNVIGVDNNGKYHKISEYDYICNSPINIRCSVRNQLLWNGKEKTICHGNSFLAPHIANIILLAYNNEIKTYEELQGYLKTNSTNFFEFPIPELKQQTFRIEKAVVFPFNKEIHSMARFETMLPFTINTYYDTRYQRNVGKALSSFGISNDKIICDIDSLNWNEDFDTFILGHTSEISELMNYNYVNRFINLCLMYRKNLFCFDDIGISEDTKKRFLAQGLKIYFPNIKKETRISNTVGKLYKLASPVLGIFGTSSRQGKFTLQLHLRSMFMAHGYTVAQIGTEPSSLLYGFDGCYPLGYNSNEMYTNSSDRIIDLNNLFSEADSLNPDILIFGSQSHTVPRNVGHIGCYPLYQQDIIFASNPDGYILCVNIFDEDDYIDRTINYLESISTGKVIALVISPMREADKLFQFRETDSIHSNNEHDKLQKFAEKTKKRTDKPVYDFSEKNLNLLFNSIINYYAD